MITEERLPDAVTSCTESYWWVKLEDWRRLRRGKHKKQTERVHGVIQYVPDFSHLNQWWTWCSSYVEMYSFFFGKSNNPNLSQTCKNMKSTNRKIYVLKEKCHSSLYSGRSSFQISGLSSFCSFASIGLTSTIRKMPHILSLLFTSALHHFSHVVHLRHGTIFKKVHCALIRKELGLITFQGWVTWSLLSFSLLNVYPLLHSHSHIHTLTL